jgi:membrane-associated HD superfamily phosphohydrolase
MDDQEKYGTEVTEESKQPEYETEGAAAEAIQQEPIEVKTEYPHNAEQAQEEVKTADMPPLVLDEEQVKVETLDEVGKPEPTQAEKDAAILKEADHIKRDPERFKAARSS